MDKVLSLLAAEANAGHECPAVSLLAGNSLFVGTPAPHEGFEEASERQVAESLYYAMKPTRATAEAAYREATAQAADSMATLRKSVAEVSDAGEVITLRDVEIWPASGGDGVHLSTARVPLSSVDGWWTGKGTRLKAEGGGGFFFGVVAPLPEA